jgi:GTP-binding protein
VADGYDVLDARFLGTAVHVSGLPAPAHPEVAFGGRSNVGKSSLLNVLLARRGLVRTSAKPGCTRALNVFRATLRGNVVVDLVDLPGYGFAHVAKAERGSWGTMVEGYLCKRATLRAVVVVVDARRGVEDDDARLLEYLAHLGRPALLVVTKIDKLPASRRAVAIANAGRKSGLRAIGFSSETREGREALWHALLRACGLRPATDTPTAGATGSASRGDQSARPAAAGSDGAAAGATRASAEAVLGVAEPGTGGGAAATGKSGTSRT